MDEKAYLEDRRLLDGIMKFLHGILSVLTNVLDKIDTETRRERTVITELPAKGNVKKRVRIEVQPLSVDTINSVIDENNLTLSVKVAKDLLLKVDHLSVTEEEAIKIVESLPDINPYYFSTPLPIGEDNNFLVAIDLKCAIEEWSQVGYGKPEKYNQPFYLIVRRAIQLLSKLGY